ncbi:MAG: imidazole glycerol phosphate synthase subunit HisH [Candidatus Omnitrophica bacterium]|nr:imidazole glycerol phosphate synthase subunit HisH [Candidatus Omnitrophota bacterium]
MIAIIDYGMGNIHSVQKALESFGAETVVTNQPQAIKACDKVILPGVGAFEDALAELKKYNLISALCGHIKSKKTFLGICLGLQLLFSQSQEANHSKGLAILKGRVVKFPDTNGLKVPHIGWNQLKKAAEDCPLLKDIPDKSYVYFCHSYYAVPDDDIVAATCDYGVEFAAVVCRDNIYGVQFHPEKSQALGLKVIENFINLC